MKSKTLAIIAAMCICLISCNWFAEKTFHEKSISLVGKWKNKNSADSSKKQNGTGSLALVKTTDEDFPVKQDLSTLAFQIRQWTDFPLQLFSSPHDVLYTLNKR